MKTSRRHELQHNALADSLARWIEFIKPYSRAALALVVAVVVVIFAWGYLSAQSTRHTAEAWNAYFSAMSSNDPREELADIAARYSGSDVAPWARITLAEIQLENGTSRLLHDKKSARDELRQAAEKYRAILLESKQAMMLERATFGLARTHEALGTPESLDNARKEYRSIGEQWPDSPYAKDAARRAADLDRATTKDFYDWLAAYEPPRPMRGEPGTPGARPDFLKDPLEEAGGLKVPSSIGDSAPLPRFDLTPGATTSSGDEPKSEGDAKDSPEGADNALNAPSESSEAPPAPEGDAPGAPEEDKPAPKP